MYEYSAKVDRVIDGDTIVVRIDLGFSIFWETPVRLFGINAPEMNSKSPLERAEAKVAKSFLADAVLNKTVKLRSAKPKDKYGRYLAEVWLLSTSERSVNDQMVRLGLAKPWDGQGQKP